MALALALSDVNLIRKRMIERNTLNPNRATFSDWLMPYRKYELKKDKEQTNLF